MLWLVDSMGHIDHSITFKLCLFAVEFKGSSNVVRAGIDLLNELNGIKHGNVDSLTNRSEWMGGITDQDNV